MVAVANITVFIHRPAETIFEQTPDAALAADHSVPDTDLVGVNMAHFFKVTGVFNFLFRLL